ncbi:MAG: UDP-glucose 4-epimerase GalE, partial [Terriglobales bacterium]
GAGYIGSVMTAALLVRGHHVVVCDNLGHGHRDAVSADAAFVECDMGDRTRVEAALRGHHIEAVIHMAAHIEVGESVREPGKYLDNNTVRGVALAEAMLAADTQCLILSSTAAVYAPSPAPLTETSPLQPGNPYGLSKLFLEHVLAWYATRGLRYYALRYFNAAGATAAHGERHQPESHLIPLVLEAAAGERPAIQIFGDDYDTPDGTCIRDYIHVSDLADAHLLALDRLAAEPAPAAPSVIPDLTARAFNLGNGRGFSVREVIAAAERVSGRRIPVEIRPRRPGDVDRLVASSDKIRALGWQPQVTALDAIVASAWRWKQNRARAAR